MDITISHTKILLIIISSFFIFIPALSANPCKPNYCDTDTSIGPEIRFPFRLADRDPARCGYPGFDLHCNSQNQTILNIPRSGEYLVDRINYSAQTLFINDPGLCLPTRILNFSLSGSRFRGVHMRNYTLLNCSSDYTDYTSARYMRLFCLSGMNYTVLAMNSHSAAAGAELPPSCRRIASALFPMRWTVPQLYWSSMDLKEDLELIWSEPKCSKCVNRGGFCGYKSESGPEIACYMSDNSGLPRRAKYGLIIGIGIPGLVCIIGLICYICGMIWSFTLRGHLINLDLPTTFSDQRPVIRSSSGLDKPTIDSYPTTILGESRRLPKTSDVTCPICLSDYQPKETLRSIPECNHYFHAGCIDEWLKLNNTCPVCRNSPESSVATPGSSSLSISSPSSSSSSSMTSNRD